MDTVHYAVCLNMKGRKCVVIGGGRVALRKVRQILLSGANVTIISPELHSELQALVEAEQIHYESREYMPSDLDSAHIVFAATNSRDVNRQVWSDAESAGKLVNVVDDANLCSFIVPAVLQRGPLQIAVSTSGTDPAGAKRIRDALAEHIEAVESAFAKTVCEWTPSERKATAPTSDS